MQGAQGGGADLALAGTAFRDNESDTFAKARDGYMRYPAITWNQRKRAFLCPDCGKPLLMEYSDDGIQYLVNADPPFFLKEHRGNRVCRECGSMLWAPVNPGRNIPWTKIPNFGWVYQSFASNYLWAFSLLNTA